MSSAALQLEPVEVIVRPMLTFDRAADDFLGDCVRRGFTPRTVTTYRRTYDLLTDRLPTDTDVSKITTDDLRRFLNSHSRLSPGTLHGFESHLSTLFRHLYADGTIARNPMDRVIRTRRKRSEDLDVVTVSSDDVRRLIAATSTWSERLTLAVVACLGPRRHATAMLRLSDYDELHGRLRFREKGGKTIWKPVPLELDGLIKAAIAAGVYSDSLNYLADSDHSADPYLIPPEAKLQLAHRNDRVIWRIVKKVADRAGVKTHVHALRAAFAVAYLERERDLVGLQELLGHTKAETTKIYLRKLDKAAAMEPVRNFTWGVALVGNEERPAIPQIAGELYAEPRYVGAGGFEPPQAEPRLPDTGISLPLEQVLHERLDQAVSEPGLPCRADAAATEKETSQ